MFCNNCGKEFKEALPVCDQCGAPLKAPNAAGTNPQPPVTPPPAAPAPQGEKPKKKGNKAIMMAIIAVVLVVAIVCGIIFIPKLFNKDGGEGTGEGTTAAVKTNIVYDSAPETPQGQTFEAAAATLFDSEKIDVSFVLEGEKLFTLNIDFGENLADTTAVVEINEGSETVKITLENSVLKAEYMGETEEVPVEEILNQPGFKEMIEGIEAELGIELFDVIDLIINNGLDLNEIGKLLDEEAIAYLEQMLVDEYGVEVDIPDSLNILSYVADFLETGVSEEALNFEEISTENGTTYSISVDLSALIEDIGEYVKSEQGLRDLVQVWIDYQFGDEFPEEEGKDPIDVVVDMFVEYALEDFGYPVSQTAQVTIKDGRISNVTIIDGSEEFVNVSITSK